MGQYIIKTKLSIPLCRENSVTRPALIARLSEGFACNRQITLVSAPPGYGKTTLIVEWSKKSDSKFVWLTLDKGDNEPVRFFSYFIAALQQHDRNIGFAASSLLDAPQFPPADMLTGAIVNDIAELPERIVLVMDDFQHIHDETITEALKYLFENQPPTLHIVLITRQDPPISLARLRAKGRITEFRKEDLRFSCQESVCFIKNTMNMQLSEGWIRMLEAKTEGWAAGLQLAAISVKGRDVEALSGFFDEFNGTQRYILDYLFEEAFVQLPEDIKKFLVYTSVLERLSGPLCDELLCRRDSASILEKVHKANLFISPLDEFGHWYRFHTLFRDILKTELDPGKQKELHFKAAGWFEKNELYDEAINHAVLSECYDVLERLLAKTAWSQIQHGEIRTLLAYIKALPEERIIASSEIRMYLAWCLLLTGNGKEASEHMNAIDLTELIRYRPEIKANMLILQIFKSVSFKEMALVQLPGQADEFVGSRDPVLHTAALYCIAQIASFRGDLAGSVKYYYEAFTNAIEAEQYFMAVISVKNLSVTQLLRGRKHEAVKICNFALERLVDARGKLLPAASILYVPLGMAYYSEDELEKAYECFEKGINICRKLSLLHFAVQGEMSFALLKFALHDADSAIETIQKAIRSLGDIGMEIGIPMFTAIEAELYLRKGNLQFARKWAAETGLEGTDTPDIMDERLYFTYARLLIAEGRCEEARAILDRLGTIAEDGDRIYRLITVFVLKAVNYTKMDLQGPAAEALQKAVELAALGSYYRLFLDEDACIAPLLWKVRNTAPEFIDILVEKYRLETSGTCNAERKNATRPDAAIAGFVEPLSDRELEVLGLVVSGMTNREIAARLFISVGTAKWHITNIFSKLGVRNRVQAVEAAKLILPK